MADAVGSASYNAIKTLRMEHVSRINSCGAFNNKARTLRMEHVKGSKFTEKNEEKEKIK